MAASYGDYLQRLQQGFLFLADMVHMPPHEFLNLLTSFCDMVQAISARCELVDWECSISPSCAVSCQLHVLTAMHRNSIEVINILFMQIFSDWSSQANFRFFLKVVRELATCVLQWFRRDRQLWVATPPNRHMIIEIFLCLYTAFVFCCVWLGHYHALFFLLSSDEYVLRVVDQGLDGLLSIFEIFEREAELMLADETAAPSDDLYFSVFHLLIVKELLRFLEELMICSHTVLFRMFHVAISGHVCVNTFDSAELNAFKSTSALISFVTRLGRWLGEQACSFKQTLTGTFTLVVLLRTG